jgi:D-3-phosphoglycerate dehydrogenase
MKNGRDMGESPTKIIVAERYSESALSRLREWGDIVELDSCDDATVRAALVDADALLVRTYTRVTRELLQSGSRLKVVGRAGVGVDNIDLIAAEENDITVVHTPAASTQSVAEHTVGLMIALEHRLITGDAALRTGRFAEHRNGVEWRELADCRIGIVGMGRIGSAVGRICAAGLGMEVVYHDIRQIDIRGFDAAPVSLEALLQSADVVSLHVPLTSQTRGLMDADRLATMKPASILINTSRGAVVDNVALADALQRAAIGGAALDVFEEEPPPPGHPLMSAPGTILTPHVAGRSKAALARMNDVVDDVIAVLAGRTPKHPAQIQ